MHHSNGPKECCLLFLHALTGILPFSHIKNKGGIGVKTVGKVFCRDTANGVKLFSRIFPCLKATFEVAKGLIKAHS